MLSFQGTRQRTGGTQTRVETKKCTECAQNLSTQASQPKEALAVAMMAQRQGLARLERTEDEIYRHATDIIGRSRDLTRWMMDKGFIPEAPEG